jgi:Domain of unknown function (DUF4296)
MRKSYLFFFIALMLIACTGDQKVPKGILPQKKMQEVLWDMMSTGEFLNGFVLNQRSVDTVAESSKQYGRVLQFHHITAEEFEKSYHYYRQHPSQLKVILDTLSKRQIPPEELYKPKTDTATHIDTTRHIDTLLKPVDTLKKKIVKQDTRMRNAFRTDSIWKRKLKKPKRLPLPQ